MIYTLEDGDNQYNNVNVFMSSFGANTGDSNAITMCRDTILSYSMYSPMFIKTWLQHLSKKILNENVVIIKFHQSFCLIIGKIYSSYTHLTFLEHEMSIHI